MQIRFDAARCAALSDAAFRRLKVIAGSRMKQDGVIVLTAHTHRSQDLNRQDARHRLAEMIRRVLIAPKHRIASRPTLASKNRDRLLEGDIAAKFLAAVLVQPRIKRLLSSEHFSVDGTLIEAWASMKSFRPKAAEGDGGEGGGRNPSVDFRGEKRSNDTHESTTDPDAMLYRKGAGMEAKLCFIGHGLMENRSGLIVDARLTRASGHAERLAALSSPWATDRAQLRWVPTAATMPPILSRNRGRSTCVLTWRRTLADVARP